MAEALFSVREADSFIDLDSRWRGLFFFIAGPFRCFGAGVIRVVPAVRRERRSHSPAARHLQVTVGIRFPDPIPGIAEPMAAVCLALVSKPGDFVVSPYPEGALDCSSSSLSRLPRILTDAPVIEFDKVGQVLSGLQARCR